LVTQKSTVEKDLFSCNLLTSRSARLQHCDGSSSHGIRFWRRKKM